MPSTFLSLLALVGAGVSAFSVPSPSIKPGCKNTPNSRECWGEYNINTNYYDTVFHTGHTVEYWLNVEEVDCAPDGYLRKCNLVNGTMPGPAIVANWGDEVVVHVTNNIATNGTSIHWHGIRQLNNNQYDGTPGVTQCPIPPGTSFTYKFHASQYGTSWYHSHFSTQYSNGLYGPLIVNGPATANYDEDLGTVFLTDWDHQTSFEIWGSVANFNVTFNGAETGLINGLNTGNCTATNTTLPDPRCINGGEKFQLVFEEGKSYRLRLINVATEAWFQFSIDSHTMKVIQTDFVPIKPYETDSVLVNMGQRYDVIIEANQKPDNYWLRSGFVDFCIPNGASANITAIVRYNEHSKANPTSVNKVANISTCLDEPAASIVPWVPINLPNIDGGITYETATGEYYLGQFLRWSIDNGSFIWANWSNPALGDAINGNLGAIPFTDNVFTVGATNASGAIKQSKKTEYTVLVIDELTPIPGISHPIHLHGHDFLVLAASPDPWDGTTDNWQTINPPRRDVAMMPPNGHLAIAFALDNPGLWLVHCHITWHSSQGFGATVLESPFLIESSAKTGGWKKEIDPVCAAWDKFQPTMPFQQDDSGI